MISNWALFTGLSPRIGFTSTTQMIFVAIAKALTSYDSFKIKSLNHLWRRPTQTLSPPLPKRWYTCSQHPDTDEHLDSAIT
ncbi:unnamed protein product [Rhizophagus irregularis]|nr:unnamed protein product [Rhizophagus irregularis]